MNKVVWAVTVGLDNADRHASPRSYLVRAVDKETAEAIALNAAQRDGQDKARSWASAVMAADKYQS